MKHLFLLLPLIAIIVGSLATRFFSVGTGLEKFIAGYLVPNSPDIAENFLKLKTVHLDASGLLNQTVRVLGEIRIIGNYETYVVIEDESIRLLVDLTHLDPLRKGAKLQAGSLIEIAGRVQSGKNGKVYLIANSVSPG